ncbi:MAG: hypothetical protein WBN10_13530 [Polyangiales bacterium]
MSDLLFACEWGPQKGASPAPLTGKMEITMTKRSTGADTGAGTGAGAGTGTGTGTGTGGDAGTDADAAR